MVRSGAWEDHLSRTARRQWVPRRQSRRMPHRGITEGAGTLQAVYELWGDWPTATHGEEMLGALLSDDSAVRDWLGIPRVAASPEAGEPPQPAEPVPAVEYWRHEDGSVRTSDGLRAPEALMAKVTAKRRDALIQKALHRAHSQGEGGDTSPGLGCRRVVFDPPHLVLVSYQDRDPNRTPAFWYLMKETVGSQVGLEWILLRKRTGPTLLSAGWEKRLGQCRHPIRWIGASQAQREAAGYTTPLWWEHQSGIIDLGPIQVDLGGVTMSPADWRARCSQYLGAQEAPHETQTSSKARRRWPCVQAVADRQPQSVQIPPVPMSLPAWDGDGPEAEGMGKGATQAPHREGS